MKKALLLVVSCMICATMTFAQNNKKARYMPWEVGADLGISLFGNEFNMNSEARWNVIDHWDSKSGFGAELYVRKYFGYVMGAELAYSYNTLKGDWDESFAINTQSFDSRVNDITLQAVVNFNNLFSKERYDRDWYIFGKAGIGMGWINLKEGAITSDPDDVKYFIPVGLGAAYKLTDDIKLSVSADYKFMNTDRLDGKYETGVVGAGNTTGVWGSYAMFSVGASYTFGKHRGQSKKPESTVIPASKPKTSKPTTPAAKVEKDDNTQKSTYSNPKPASNSKKVETTTPKAAPAASSYSKTFGTMKAKAGWPVNKGYVSGEIDENGIEYRVQVLATYVQAKDLEKLGNLILISEDFVEYQDVKLYKYAVETVYSSYSSALAAARKINKTTKISDAFVTAFKGMKHIY